MEIKEILCMKEGDGEFSYARNSTVQCFVMGAPGSFFNRIFPRNGLHLVHSNYAVHWISQVPSSIYDEVGSSMNKGNIIVSEASPPSVVKAFRAQFQQDLSLFLKCRSNEVVTNGHMILAFLGTSSMEPRLHWSTKVLSQAITNLVSKGLITKEKAHSFAMPLHFPSKEEVQKIVIEEGSFTIEKIETIVEDAASEVKDVEVRAKAITKAIRAGIEVLVSHHFGDQVWVDLYPELKQAILLHLKNEPVEMFNIIFMLKKIV